MSAYRDVSVVRAKVEATEQTDPVTAQGDEVRHWGLVVDPSFDPYVAEAQDGQSSSLGVTIGGARTALSLNTYALCPNAADGHSTNSAPEWAPLAIASGLQLVYDPEVGGDNTGSVVVRPADVTATTGNNSSATIDAWEDDRSYKVLGWRGGWKWSAKRGEPAMWNWAGKGLFAAPGTTAMPAVSATTVDTSGLVVVGGANCLSMTPSGGAAYYPLWEDLSIESGQDVTEYPNGNAATMTGGFEIPKFGRKGSLKIVTQAEAGAAPGHQWFAAIRAQTIYDLALTIGSVVQSRCALAVKLQLTGIKESKENGYLVQTLEFVCVRDTATANNDFKLTYT